MANKIFITFLAILLPILAFAQESESTNNPLSASDFTCPNAKIFGTGLISNVCWSCMFPIRVFGVNIGSGSVPDGAYRSPLCACPDPLLGIPIPGIPLSMWEPARLVEVVREPYCSPVLGGSSLKGGFNGFRLSGVAAGDEVPRQYYNVHYWAFPLHLMLGILTGSCTNDGFVDLDLMYMSELDPTHADDELALLTGAEGVAVSSLVAQSACPADCIASSIGKPIDSLFWCAGCWGHLYPFTGNLAVSRVPPRNAALIATKELAKLHRAGLAWRTVGEKAMCGAYIYPVLPKTQYKLSQLYPMPEASGTFRKSTGTCNDDPKESGSGDSTGSSNSVDTGPDSDGNSPSISGIVGTCLSHKGCCHAIGSSQYLWGEWRNIPAIGEDFVEMVWRYKDCCVH